MFDPRTGPKCEAPGCKERGFMLIGRRFFCGPHAQQVLSRMKEQQDAFIMEGFKNDKNDAGNTSTED
jgi:hypothetical protein